LLSGKGPFISVVILSNSALTLYWCTRPLLEVWGPWFAAQVPHCWHHLPMTLLVCSQ
jgi:hypothetical protein